MAGLRCLGPAPALAASSVLVLLGPAGTAGASCRYVPTVADGRFQGPFTISSGTPDVDVFFQSRYGSSYSVEAMIVSEPYYVGSLSGNLDVADCPSTDYEFLRRTETIDPAPDDFLFTGMGVRPYYRASFYGLHGGVGYDVCLAFILLAPDGTYTVSTGTAIPPGRTASFNTVSMGAPRNRTGTAKILHDCPPGAILAQAAIANFNLSPTPYYQGVEFEPVRAAH